MKSDVDACYLIVIMRLEPDFHRLDHIFESFIYFLRNELQLRPFFNLQEVSVKTAGWNTPPSGGKAKCQEYSKLGHIIKNRLR